jgi:hypothetical protein
VFSISVKRSPSCCCFGFGEPRFLLPAGQVLAKFCIFVAVRSPSSARCSLHSSRFSVSSVSTGCDLIPACFHFVGLRAKFQSLVSIWPGQIRLKPALFPVSILVRSQQEFPFYSPAEFSRFSHQERWSGPVRFSHRILFPAQGFSRAGRCAHRISRGYCFSLRFWFRPIVLSLGRAEFWSSTVRLSVSKPLKRLFFLLLVLMLVSFCRPRSSVACAVQMAQ